jgi:hypothetical protein
MIVSQTFTDPSSGRPYGLDPETGAPRWLDQAPPPPPPIDTPPATRVMSHVAGQHDLKHGHSRWMIPAATGVLGLILGAVITSAGTTNDQGAVTASTATVTRTENVTPLADVRTTTVTAPAAATSQAATKNASPVMPALIGQSLFAAYETLKTAGIDETLVNSHDDSGLGRTVLMPSNWKVCSQVPKKGASVGPGTVIELGNVKFGEPCS